MALETGSQAPVATVYDAEVEQSSNQGVCMLNRPSDIIKQASVSRSSLQKISCDVKEKSALHWHCSSKADQLSEVKHVSALLFHLGQKQKQPQHKT